jgi:hypothetical protein
VDLCLYRRKGRIQQASRYKKDAHVQGWLVYDAPMKHIIALGFAVALTLSACGGGATSSTPDGNTGGSIEETNARLTAIIKQKLDTIESLEGTSVVDASNYSSTNYEVRYMVLTDFQGTLVTWTMICEYQLTADKFTRISYLKENEFGTETQTGDSWCPASE